MDVREGFTVTAGYSAAPAAMDAGILKPRDDSARIGQLERVFPAARAFVRPGLDEPDEVTKLIASEGARR